MTLDSDGKGSLTEAAARALPDFATVPREADDLAALLYTSGTTGRSKGAMLTHGNLVSNTQALQDAWRYTADDVLIHALPIFHTHGLFVATNVTLFSGASMIFLPKFDPDRIISIPAAAVVATAPPIPITATPTRPDISSNPSLNPAAGGGRRKCARPRPDGTEK